MNKILSVVIVERLMIYTDYYEFSDIDAMSIEKLNTSEDL